MIEELISGIIYTEFDDALGPNPVLWIPNISEETLMLISIKTITLLTGEESHTPKDLVIIPFPSLNSKGLTKYIEWADSNRRGGIGRAAITMMFKEFNDIIFYKYRDDLHPQFEKISAKISSSEELRNNKENLKSELVNFFEEVKNVLSNLRKKEIAEKDSDAFPDADKGEQRFDYRFKVIVCGDPSVGKTSTVLRFTYNAFTRTYLPTIGVNISEKNITVNNLNVQLVIWDIAGQTKFQTMRKHFYQGAEGIFLIFDLTYEKSFNNVANWYKDIFKNLKKDSQVIGYLIGNKTDLVDERVIKKENAENLANEINFEYIETSALTGENVNLAFYNIAETLLKLKIKE
ncbi:MAG: Rab family GTPase [Promethearchaeota archaeon]